MASIPSISGITRSIKITFRVKCLRLFHRLQAIPCFSDDLDIRHEFQYGFHASADDGVIIHHQHTDFIPPLEYYLPVGSYPYLHNHTGAFAWFAP